MHHGGGDCGGWWRIGRTVVTVTVAQICCYPLDLAIFRGHAQHGYPGNQQAALLRVSSLRVVVGCCKRSVDATSAHDETVTAYVGGEQRDVRAQAERPLELDGVQEGQLVHPGGGEDQLTHSLEDEIERQQSPIQAGFF